MPTGWSSENIIKKLERESDEKEFYRLIELILNLQFREQMSTNRFMPTLPLKDMFFFDVENAIRLSNLKLNLSMKNDGIIVYPQGEKWLDDGLVDQTLQFLGPESNKHFKDALTYLQKKEYVNATEKVRRAIEEFLREKLANKTGFKGNLKKLGKKLKELSAPKEFRDTITMLLKNLDTYFNENSKHNDGPIGLNECHFLIYVTASIMKYIDDQTL